MGQAELGLVNVVAMATATKENCTTEAFQIKGTAHDINPVSHEPSTRVLSSTCFGSSYAVTIATKFTTPNSVGAGGSSVG